MFVCESHVTDKLCTCIRLLQCTHAPPTQLTFMGTTISSQYVSSAKNSELFYSTQYNLKYNFSAQKTWYIAWAQTLDQDMHVSHTFRWPASHCTSIYSRSHLKGIIIVECLGYREWRGKNGRHLELDTHKDKLGAGDACMGKTNRDTHVQLEYGFLRHETTRLFSRDMPKHVCIP